MFTMRRSPLMRTVLTPLTLATFLSACSSWATLKEPVAVSIAAQQPDKVRVTTTDEREIILTSPAVQDDTLSGVLPGTRPEFGSASYPLSQVAAVEVWRPSTRGEPNWIATEVGIADLCAEQVTQLRLTLVNDRQVVLGSPQIEDDRVAGTALDFPVFPRMAIALADVTRVEKYQGDSSGVVVLLLVGAGVAVALIAASSGSLFETGGS